MSGNGAWALQAKENICQGKNSSEDKLSNLLSPSRYCQICLWIPFIFFFTEMFSHWHLSSISLHYISKCWHQIKAVDMSASLKRIYDSIKLVPLFLKVNIDFIETDILITMGSIWDKVFSLLLSQHHSSIIAIIHVKYTEGRMLAQCIIPSECLCMKQFPQVKLHLANITKQGKKK